MTLQSVTDLDEETYDRLARAMHDEVGATCVTDEVAAWFQQTASQEPCEVCAVIKRRMKALTVALDEATTIANRGRP